MSDRPSAPQAQPKTANARRVARHKQKQASQGFKQVNIQAPIAAHPILKDLGQRLKAGQPIEEALFELAAAHARKPSRSFAPDGEPEERPDSAGLTGRLVRLLRRRTATEKPPGDGS